MSEGGGFNNDKLFLEFRVTYPGMSYVKNVGRDTSEFGSNSYG